MLERFKGAVGGPREAELGSMFTVNAKHSPQGFHGDQSFVLADYGLEINLTFDTANQSLVPDTAVPYDNRKEAAEQLDETIEVTEPTEELPSGEEFRSSVQAGPNHKPNGDFAAYPGDTIHKSYSQIGRHYSFFEGIENKDDIDLDHIMEPTYASDPSAAEALTSIGVLDDTEKIVRWGQEQYTMGLLDWSNVKVYSLDVLMYEDVTDLTVLMRAQP